MYKIKSLILFSSRHGTAGECSRLLARELTVESHLSELPLRGESLLEEYELVVVGGSIYAGRMDKNIRSFCRDYRDQLLQKELGLFICCLQEEMVEKYVEEAFPPELLEHAVRGYFGSRIIFEEMNFFTRIIMKLITKEKKSLSQIREEAISEFAEKLINH